MRVLADPTLKTFSCADLDPDDLNRVAAIVYYGRSGSLFLSSLLDDHPHTVAIPGMFLFNFHDVFWPRYGFLPAPELIACFVHFYLTAFDAREEWPTMAGRQAGVRIGFTAMGPNRDQHVAADRNVFAAAMEKFLPEGTPVSRKRFFQAAHLAYNAALGRRLATRAPLLVFQMHQPDDRARPLVEDFPATRFLHMIREPVQTLASHFTHHYRDDREQVTIGVLGYLMAGVLLGGKPLLASHAEQSRAVRLEDLHQQPRATLGAVCAFIEIPWNDCVLKSTFNGLQWWNVDKSPQVSGFTTTTISQRHATYVTAFDRWRLRLLLAKKYRRWNYPLPRWNAGNFAHLLLLPLLLWPFKMERLIWPFKAKQIDVGFLNRPLFYGYIRVLLLRAWLLGWNSPEGDLQLVNAAGTPESARPPGSE